MLVVFTGIIFCTSGFLFKVPKGVIVNGVDVGGKTYSDAVSLLRENIKEGINLKVKGVAEYSFTYPEIDFSDNLKDILKKAKKDGVYEAKITYRMRDIYEISARICADEEVCACEPYAIFNSVGEPFTYFEGQNGRRADRLKLISDIQYSLANGFTEVNINFIETPTFRSMKDIEYDTRLLSSYTTYFDGGNFERAHNIELAAESINGKILERGEEFSFNGTVGERSEKRGYKTAKIISKGEFIDGVGGGVCQVSTTLFNAAVLAGCKITECHPHSLTVSYVPPSCDAMVSGDYYDLKFENTTGSRLYVRAFTGGNFITFKIYGRGDGAEYFFESRVLDVIPAPVEEIEDENVRDGKDGIISEGYLTVKRGSLATTKFLRRDKYTPLSARIKKPAAQETEEKVEP